MRRIENPETLPVHNGLAFSDFYLEVAKGNIPGHSAVHKFGRNEAVPNGSWAFVNELGFTAWPLSAATTVRIKAGGDVADTAAGAGAMEVTVQGIDDSFNEVTEAIDTAGVSASLVTSTSFWRVHRAWVSAVGTYGAANTGDIVIENSGGGTDLIKIDADEGQTEFGAWTVPIGKRAYITSLHVQVDSKESADVRMFTRQEIDTTTAPMKPKRVMMYLDAVSGSVHHASVVPKDGIPEKTDIWLEAFGDGAICAVACEFEILVVDNK